MVNIKQWSCIKCKFLCVSHHMHCRLGLASASGCPHGPTRVGRSAGPGSASAVVVLALDDALCDVALLCVLYVFLGIAARNAALVVAPWDPGLLEHLFAIPAWARDAYGPSAYTHHCVLFP